jgi:hypothetical protein
VSVSETPDLVAALLQADTVSASNCCARPITRPRRPLAQLGHHRSAAAAEVLGLVEVVIDDRATKKAARRECIVSARWGSAVPPPVQATVEPVAAVSEAQVEVSEAWATDIDPSGSRAVHVDGAFGAWAGSGSPRCS